MSYRPNANSIKSITDLEGIYNAMCHVFQDAQLTLSGHRKLVVILKSIHKRAIELGLEDSFSMKFTKLVNFILPLKKGEQVGDRIIKFCSVFVASLYKDQEAEREAKAKANEENGIESDEEEEEDSPTGRFVDYLLRHLLRGIQAKDKQVRYRVVQLLAYLVNNIGEIDEELFTALQWSLNRRLYDKEANVRLQAIVAISRFQYLNIPDGKKATESMLLAMQHDDSAEVRRAALLNLQKTNQTIPFLIERARDTNSINRRLIFSRISKELGDFRELNIEVRESLLRWGLHDREASVQSAAVKMFASNWFETVQEDLIELIDTLNVVNSDIADTAIMTFYKSRQEYISKISITKEMWKELTTELAFFIRTFYEYCNENSLFDLIDKFFPESIELTEILSKYFTLRKSFIGNNREVIQTYETMHSQLEQLRNEEYELEHERDDPESKTRLKKVKQEIEVGLSEFEEPRTNYINYYDQLKELEFIIKQLVLVAKDYDFSDEIGRREMLRIIRLSLTNDELSDELIKLSLKVLKKISINDRDFSTMCTEIVTDIRDSYMDDVDDDTFHSAISTLNNDSEEEKNEDDDDEEEEEDDDNDNDQEGNNGELSNERSNPNKRRKKEPKQPPNEILIQCLLITQHLLEITEESISNVSLSSLLDSLVRPSVLRNDNTYIRNLAMTCLGLFCLLDKQLAIQQLYLFGVAASRADEELRIISIKVIVDILSTHGVSVLDIEGQVDSLSLAKLFYKVLRLYEMPKLQCVVAEGLCKLFLADNLADFGKNKNNQGEEPQEQEDQEKVLFETLILTYFHPQNENNHELRQILAFCIPVYAFSHQTHQDKVASISGDCFFRIFRENGEFERFENVTSPTTIIQQLIHWCDPNNLVNITPDEIKKSSSHFWQVLGFLQVIEQDTPKNIKKVIISNLNRIYLTEELGSTVLSGLKKAIEDTRSVIETNQNDPSFVLDSTTDRSFEKFYQSVRELTERAIIIEEEKKKEEGLVEKDEISINRSINDGTEIDREITAEPKSEDIIEMELSKNNIEEDGKINDKEVNEEELNNEEDLQDSLQKIDELLDEEEGVDYDISMEE
ncbi:condensin complex subunit 3 [[Candida] anglica]|uniref:Condensin complex subunit 3 n=1 Tax=[Candida] anglica TaxID=148631 RepID=A0ABP0EI62_9ASCO